MTIIHQLTQPLRISAPASNNGAVLSRVEHIGNATLYLGDCREILPTLAPLDVIVTDPPYGLGDKWKGGKDEWPLRDADGMAWDADTVAYVNELPALATRHAIIWGGHLYSLPPKRGWLIWDKGNERFSSGAAELAWSTLDQPIRKMTLGTNVFTPFNAKSEEKYHPTQKPVPVMQWCLSFIPDAEGVCDPFMGCGSTGVAALGAGKAFTGIEISEKYFDIACRRLDQAQRQFTLAV